jgi:hypothetical protein
MEVYMKVFWSLVGLATILSWSILSCASAPKSPQAPTEASPAAPTAPTKAEAPAEPAKKPAEVPDYLIQSRKAAEASRAKALDIKANVADKTDFDQGEALYAQGVTLQNSGTYDQSNTAFIGADGAYQKAWATASSERDKAEKAMAQAETDRKAAEQAILKDQEALKSITDSSNSGETK